MTIKPKPKSSAVTDEMLLNAKPAVYTGCAINRKTGKVKFVCWPGVKFPGRRDIVVLEDKDCRSVKVALALATERLEAERRKVLMPKKRKAKA